MEVLEKTHTVDLFVGKQIKIHRKKRRLSQEDLGRLVQLSRQQIQLYEQGRNRVCISTLFKISKALHISFSDIIGNVDLLNLEQDNDNNNDIISLKRARPLNILMVEDESADELITRKALENCAEHRTNIHLVYDGIEAIAFLKNPDVNIFPKPDIILLDLNIPKKDGLEVLKDIKRDKELCLIPVIVLTNSINSIDMERSYMSGASGFISKSVNVHDFYRNIEIIVNYWATMVLPRM